MITVAILGILSAVAIPAYSNYMNRAKQSDAIIGLKAAQMAQEQYFSENNEYSKQIDILPGFNDGTTDNSYEKGVYTLTATADTDPANPSFTITATSSTLNDRWKIDESMIDPEADLNATYPGIKGYSVFGWIFD
ncbi:MAG: hypothetical protein J7J71_05350 [Deltaproteobacteria bacterium]|nr:hypothetical protein [Candidatus Tharpella sp.]